ncbi:MAG TPA: aldo/keto reductase [Steroidobacteraceae bacterium]
METRRIGNSDLEVSIIGLGCNNFGLTIDAVESRKVIRKAIELGVTFFDTSNTYGNPKGTSETILGGALAPMRNQVVVATKCGKALNGQGRLKGGARRTIMESVEESLTRLKTGWIDLMYMHDPDPSTSIEESLRAFDDLVNQGKVRSIACSNFCSGQMSEAAMTAAKSALPRFIASQDEYNLLNRKAEERLFPTIQALGLGFIPYFPLASGLLTGKYQRDHMPAGSRLTDAGWFADHQLSDENWQKVARLRDFCDQTGRPMVELAFGWLASQPMVASIIAGATRAQQVEQNVKAVACNLDSLVLARLSELTQP